MPKIFNLLLIYFFLGLLSIGEPLAAMKEDLNAAMQSHLFDSNLNFGM